MRDQVVNWVSQNAQEFINNEVSVSNSTGLELKCNYSCKLHTVVLAKFSWGYFISYKEKGSFSYRTGHKETVNITINFNIKVNKPGDYL